MLYLNIVILTFVWLKQDVGSVTERYTYGSIKDCEVAKQDKIKEHMDKNWQGLIISRTLHADCIDKTQSN